MNLFSTGDSYSKFDCIDNSRVAPTDFNALWASSDDRLTQGGQLNAILLLNPGKKIISGFFGLNGARCDDFSEFASDSDIKGYSVDPGAGGTAQVVPGYVIPVPTVDSYLTLKTSLHKAFPSQAKDYLRCPILIRAALVATCPSNPMMPVAQKAFPSLGSPERCGAAATLQVHIRMEQLYEIKGQPKLQAVDTVKDLNAAGTISLERIIAQKTGTQCEPGTVPRGPVCIYPSP